MNKEEKILPALRFPEFENDGKWELTTIGKNGKFYYGKSAPKWSLSEDAPTLCVRYGELYTKFGTIINEVVSRTNIDPKTLKFSKGGEILVPRVGEDPYAFSKCSYLPFPNIAIGEMISVYETKQDPIFYTYYFNTLSKQFARVVEGQNVKNLYYVNLEPIKIGKPHSIKEQQKIANCLSSLDTLITAETVKLAHLKDHKKGLLQILFPANGETKPQFRFPEFENDGDWLKKELGIALDGKSSQIAKNKLSFIENGYAVFGADGMLGYIDSYTQEDDYIAIVKDGSGVGNLFYYQGKSSLLGTLNYLFSKDDKKYILKWLYYLLQTISFKPFIKGSGIPHIYYKDYSKLLVLIPKNPKEQQKIANCLSSADDLIEAQTTKIKSLKKHKKGLMQQLFPNTTNL
jgi:type I restriction enzyme S subunit